MNIIEKVEAAVLEHKNRIGSEPKNIYMDRHTCYEYFTAMVEQDAGGCSVVDLIGWTTQKDYDNSFCPDIQTPQERFTVWKRRKVKDGIVLTEDPGKPWSCVTCRIMIRRHDNGDQCGSCAAQSRWIVADVRKVVQRHQETHGNKPAAIYMHQSTLDLYQNGLRALGAEDDIPVITTNRAFEICHGVSTKEPGDDR